MNPIIRSLLKKEAELASALKTLDETVGVQTGDLCVVTADGCASMHDYPLELVRV